MPCMGCGGARRQVFTSVRQGNVRGAYQGVTRGLAIIGQKMRGTYDDSKYSEATYATPYRRPQQQPVERSK